MKLFFYHNILMIEERNYLGFTTEVSNSFGALAPSAIMVRNG